MLEAEQRKSRRSAADDDVAAKVMAATLPDVKIIMLDKDRESAWHLMPGALERVRAFCKRHNTDDDPEVLATAIMQHFVVEKPLFKLIVAVRSDGAIVAHALATIEQGHRGMFLVVRQHDVDEDARIPIDLLRAGMEALFEWGRMYGAERQRALVANEENERRLRTFYGFKRIRIVMERGP